MAFKDYGNYDGVGLADLVRKKEVTPKELLDEAVARTARVDPQLNAVVVKHYDYAGEADRARPARRSLHRRAVPAEGPRISRAARARRRRQLSGPRRRSQRHPRARFREAGLAIFGKTQSGDRIGADHRAAAVRPDPQPLEPRALLRRLVGRRGGGGRRAASCRSRTPATAAARSASLPRLRPLRPEADPRAHAARSRPRRRLGRLLLRPRGQHQRARQRRDARRRSADPSRPALSPRRRRSGPMPRRSARARAAADRLHRASTP